MVVNCHVAHARAIRYRCLMMDGMTQRENEATGSIVAANVSRYRKALGLSYRTLAGRLADAGHPIVHTQLRNIEIGLRRVTVDDLTALAVALEVSPLSLLLPETASAEVDCMITGLPESPNSLDVWRWGLCLSRHGILPDSGDEAQDALFRRRSSPVPATGERTPR